MTKKREFYPIRSLTRLIPDGLRTERRRPRAPGTHRREPLHDRRPLEGDASLLERDDREPRARHVEQLAVAQQELRVRRPAEALVAGRERFVQQRAVVVKLREQMREQRPMQIVGDDDRIERLAREWPRARFQIGLARLDSRLAGERAERRTVAVDREHLRTARCEEACVPAATGCDVEHARTRRHEMREAGNPRRRLQHRVRVRRCALHWVQLGRCDIAATLRTARFYQPGRRRSDDGGARRDDVARFVDSSAACSASQPRNATTSSRSATRGAASAK